MHVAPNTSEFSRSTICLLFSTADGENTWSSNSINDRHRMGAANSVHSILLYCLIICRIQGTSRFKLLCCCGCHTSCGLISYFSRRLSSSVRSLYWGHYCEATHKSRFKSPERTSSHLKRELQYARDWFQRDIDGPFVELDAVIVARVGCLCLHSTADFQRHKCEDCWEMAVWSSWPEREDECWEDSVAAADGW